MPAAAVQYSDAGVSVATCENLFVCVFRQPSTVERMREIRRQIEKHVQRHGVRTLSMSVVEPGAAGMVPREVRDAAAALTRDFPSIAAAVVIEGHGFRNAALRAALSALYLIARSPYPHKFVDSVTRGALWLVSEAARAESRLLAARDIEAAVATARAAIA